LPAEIKTRLLILNCTELVEGSRRAPPRTSFSFQFLFPRSGLRHNESAPPPGFFFTKKKNQKKKPPCAVARFGLDISAVPFQNRRMRALAKFPLLRSSLSSDNTGRYPGKSRRPSLNWQSRAPRDQRCPTHFQRSSASITTRPSKLRDKPIPCKWRRTPSSAGSKPKLLPLGASPPHTQTNEDRNLLPRQHIFLTSYSTISRQGDRRAFTQSIGINFHPDLLGLPTSPRPWH